MRLINLVLASYFLGGSSVAARSKVPFVRNEVKRSASATTIASMIPRGGASIFPKQNHKDLTSLLSSASRSKTKKGVSTDTSVRGGADDDEGLIPRVKRGWAISLALSVLYLVLLLTKGGSGCDYSQDGFCVTSLEKVGGVVSCNPNANSHLWAWQVDAVFTALVIGLGVLTGAETKLIGSLIAAVLMHGLLHLFFSKNNCFLAAGDGEGGLLIIFANVAYAAFIALISLVALKDVPQQLSTLVTILGTAATVWLSQPSQGFGVSPIFMYTQLLVSLVSYMSSKNTQLMGDLFVLPCLTSIIELLYCCDNGKQGLFNKIGGHVWYDFFLHTSLLATYFPGEDVANSPKK